MIEEVQFFKGVEMLSHNLKYNQLYNIYQLYSPL